LLAHATPRFDTGSVAELQRLYEFFSPRVQSGNEQASARLEGGADVMRSEWLLSPDAPVDLTPPSMRQPPRNRRFGMAKRIEQSRRHGYYDPRWTLPVLVASASPLPVDEPDEPFLTPPTLTLVGGTDLTPTPLDPLALGT
jgi:hypothetical protein